MPFKNKKGIILLAALMMPSPKFDENYLFCKDQTGKYTFSIDFPDLEEFPEEIDVAKGQTGYYYKNIQFSHTENLLSELGISRERKWDLSKTISQLHAYLFYTNNKRSGLVQQLELRYDIGTDSVGVIKLKALAGLKSDGSFDVKIETQPTLPSSIFNYSGKYSCEVNAHYIPTIPESPDEPTLDPNFGHWPEPGDCDEGPC